MLAVDTNLIVRYLTRDDLEQAARARALINDFDVFVCTTVLLETEWVLRSTYRYKRDQVIHALRSFVALPHVVLEDFSVAGQALDWAEQGMDLADALHLAKAQSCEAFITFDQHLAATGAALSPIPIRSP